MADVSGTSARKPSERYTLDQWRSWPEGERWELIGGEAWAMSPSPRYSHQRAALNLATALAKYLEGKPCQPIIAPMDVFLNEDDTVVNPDVMVVCRPELIQEDGVHGAPDLVVEILSESTAFRDLGLKKTLYQDAGVREYWIIHPQTGTVMVFTLDGTVYAPAVEYLPGSPVPSTVLPGFTWRFILA